MHIKLVRQHDEKDCGVACLSMVLNRYHSTIPLSRLREMAGTDNDGTSAFGIKSCADELGLQCTAVKADSTIWSDRDLTFPLIAHVIVNGGLLHFVVVYGVKNHKLLIADPGQGKYQVTIDEFSNSWTGILLLFHPADDYTRIKEKEAGLTSFLPILLKQKGLIINVILASTILTIFGIVGSYYFQLVIDYFVPSGALNTLNLVSVALVVMYLFQAVFEYSRNYILTILGQKMGMSIMLDYIHHVFHLPMNFFATRKSGEIISRFLDANKIIDALASATLSLFLDVGMIIVLGITLGIQNMTLFLITLGSIPFYGAVVVSFIKGYNRSNENEMQSGAILNSSIIESLKGIETIKSYNGEDKVYGRIDREFVDSMKNSFKRINLDNIQHSLKLVLQLLSTATVLWIGSRLVIKGQMSIGQLITFNALASFFTTPLQNIINLQVKMQTASVANHRLNEIFFLDEEPLIVDKNQGWENTLAPSDLNISEIDFSYGMKLPALESVSVQIHGNEKVAIVGMSGSGKSTLAKLMVNFYQPSAGTICLGAMNIQDINRTALRRYITYVPQESFFFSGTILDNLTFGLSDEVSMQDVIRVCTLVKLIDFINSLPLRFNTVLDEGAGNISGGQKQRMAIARALLTNSKILILDEATSGLDALLEHEIVNNLIKLSDQTLIFIAHRLSIAQTCDRVFVLDKGKLIQSGTHEQLINSNGVYQELWRQS